MKRIEAVGGKIKYFKIREHGESDKWLFGKTPNAAIPRTAIAVSFIDYITGCYGPAAVTKEVERCCKKILHGVNGHGGVTGGLIIDDGRQYSSLPNPNNLEPEQLNRIINKGNFSN